MERITITMRLELRSVEAGSTIVNEHEVGIKGIKHTCSRSKTLKIQASIVIYYQEHR